MVLRDAAAGHVEDGRAVLYERAVVHANERGRSAVRFSLAIAIKQQLYACYSMLHYIWFVYATRMEHVALTDRLDLT